jgi:hypothetical protein
MIPIFVFINKYMNCKNRGLFQKNLFLQIKDHNFAKRALKILIASIQK